MNAFPYSKVSNFLRVDGEKWKNGADSDRFTESLGKSFVLDLLLNRFKGDLRIIKDGQDLGLLYENDSNLKSDAALYFTVVIGNNLCHFEVY